MNLSIIIINYNVKYFLEQCLHSVIKAASGINHEIIIVDNASSDGSRDYLEKKFLNIRFVWNEINLGFAKANNQALQMSGGEYILFLNPDTIVPEDCFQKCFKHFTNHPEAGALGVRMLDGSGNFLKESKRGFPTPLAAFFKLTGLSTLFPQSSFFSRYHMGHLHPSANHETDVLAGAFMMVRKRVLDKTGGFDESFFMYGEDIDLSYRIRKAGFMNLYFAECPILHFKGESTRKGSLNYVRLFYGAMAIFAGKHYGSMRAGFFSFSIHFAIWLRAFFSATGHFLQHLLITFSRLLPARHSFSNDPFIVANPEDYERVKRLMQQNNRLKNTIQRIAITDKLNDTIGRLDELPMLIKKYRIREIVFCENGLSFKEIIHYFEVLPKHLRIRISAKNTGSIVGSDSCQPDA
ncbi:MAG: glycosyltransferase family 2 protein [Chitinophagaceae bacterium]